MRPRLYVSFLIVAAGLLALASPPEPSARADTTRRARAPLNEPDLALSDSTVAFGEVIVDVYAREALTIRNVGTATLTVGEIKTDHPEFAVGPGSAPVGLTLAPGASHDVEIVFRPRAVGARQGHLTIPSDDPDEPEVIVPLTGEGADAPVILVAPDSLAEMSEPDRIFSRDLAIANLGAGNLHWNLVIAPAVRSRSRGALDGVDILWDRSHGQGAVSAWSIVMAELVAQGATVTENFAALTPERLGTHRVLWSKEPSTAYTSSEIALLVDWITNGGGLLLEGDNTSSVAPFNGLLNALGAGIQYSAVDGVGGLTMDIQPHVVTTGVASVLLEDYVLSSLASVQAPASLLIRDAGSTPNAAASEIGAGRIFAVADEIFGNGVVGSADNLLLAKQVIAWLAEGAWLTADRSSGTVAPQSADVVSLEFDTSGLYGGEFTLAVRVASNDPVTPVVSVPVRLGIIGVGDIAVSTDSLDLGSAPAGGSSRDTLVVRNEGSGVLTVTDVSAAPSVFAASPTAFVLDVAESAHVTVIFSPTVPDSGYDGTLTITSDDPDEGTVTVALHGEGRFDCATPCLSPFLRPNDAAGSDGYLFGLDVSIAANPTPIDAFGFDLEYDPGLLDFLDSSSAGTLTSEFVLVSAQENEPGRIVCGGFHTVAIPVSSAGSLIRLYFRVSCPSCAGGEKGDLIPGHLQDDLVGLNRCCGEFTITECANNGDVNGDGQLTPGDAFCAMLFYLNGQAVVDSCDYPGDCELLAADVNCDGEVTSGDALAIYEAYLAGDPPIPCFARGGGLPTSREEGGLAWGTPLLRDAGEIVVPLLATPRAPPACGVDVLYDPGALEFLHVERGELSGRWDFLEARRLRPGVVRLGGFAAGQTMSAGVLARLVFGAAGATGADGAALRAENVEGARWVGEARLALGGSVAALVEGIASVAPIPFRDRVTIRYAIAREGVDLELNVHDIGGRLVRSLATGAGRAGRHRASWDGRDSRGQPVAAGIYFVTLKLGQERFVRKVVLLP